MAKKPLDLSGVPNLDQLLTEAQRLGCTVTNPRRQGEVRISHPAIGYRLNLNARRKDGTRACVGFLRTLQQMERNGELDSRW